VLQSITTDYCAVPYISLIKLNNFYILYLENLEPELLLLWRSVRLPEFGLEVGELLPGGGGGRCETQEGREQQQQMGPHLDGLEAGGGQVAELRIILSYS
jgi:hypothetical protein